MSLITIEVNLSDSDEIARIVRMLSPFATVGGEAPLEAKPRKKAATPIAGNPDAPAEQTATPAPTVVAAATPAEIAVRLDAPAEIIALVQQPVDKIDKDVLGKAVLKACKPIAEGGVTRPVVLDILERYRPANLPKPELVKMGAVPPAKYPELRGLILAQYKAK